MVKIGGKNKIYFEILQKSPFLRGKWVIFEGKWVIFETRHSRKNLITQGETSKLRAQLKVSAKSKPRFAENASKKPWTNHTNKQ